MNFSVHVIDCPGVALQLMLIKMLDLKVNVQISRMKLLSRENVLEGTAEQLLIFSLVLKKFVPVIHKL